ncbi:MAG: flavodoxin family protein [Candidatus Methanoplasma sp.]|jgi:multimeric flavodoxin WrbA|nr:flavodoxin family protein [Candidatus Methanoplasma sp.]
MSIVAIISSPRKKGNTSTIVQAMIEGAKENGKEVKEYYLNQLSNAKGCQACMACKSSVGCAVKDDHAEILGAMRDAEGVILSTPCYFGESDGQFKLLQDRFYSFVGQNFVPNIGSGKKLATVVSCGAGAESAKAMADKIEGIMAGMLKFEPVGKIVFTDANPPDTASKNGSVLKEAESIGKKL